MLVVAGCLQTPEPILVPTPIPVAIIEAPKPITTRPVTFKVITDKDTDIFKDNKVLYALTVSTYESLSYNTQEMLRYIRDQKSIIRYYEQSVSK